MKKDVQKRLLIVGGVIGLGVVAYVLYDRYQNGSGGPAIAPSPTPQPLPQPKPVTQSGPSPAAIQAYKTALAEYHGYVAYLQTYPPVTAPDLDAAKARLEQLRVKVLQTASAVGATPNV